VSAPATGRRPRTDVGAAPPLVDARGLSVPGRLHDASLRVDGGAVALIGANGAGKSSLLHVLAGRLRPRGGEVRVVGVAPRDPAAARLRAYVPQQVELSPHLRGGEVLAAAARARGLTRGAARDAAARMGVQDVLDRPVGRLSGGLRQRVALAAGLIGTPRLWLLDEPASALDAGGLERLAAWAEEHVAAGGGLIVSAHRPEEVDAFAREAVLMKAGRIVDRAPVRELFVLEDAAGEVVTFAREVRRRPAARLRSVLGGDEDA
jgi:ABC-2 type transport system ATP-binding protein